MSADLPPNLREYLDTQTTLTLATLNPDGTPQACDVFYASDGTTFYFLSDPKTRHIQNLQRDPRISATIHGGSRGWEDIRGVQMAGHAERVASLGERAQGYRLYIVKYTFVGQWLPSAAALGQAHKLLGTIELYKIVPTWIRWIDNTEGFGHKEEWSVGD